MYLFNDGFSFILLLILFVVIFVKIGNLKRRVDILEDRLSTSNELEKNKVVSNIAPALDYSGQPVIAKTEVIPPAQPVISSPRTGGTFIEWLKDDWMLKLGGFLLLIGLGWFTTYAIMNNWIGEIGRITLGISAGVAILALGSWRITKYVNQGGIFLVVGSATIILTVFAARELYDMFTPLIALVIMFLSTAYISLISVKYNAFAVSLSGLILAFVSPLLIGNSDVTDISLFTYLFVLTLGAIWIVVIKNNWGALIFASLVGVFLYSMPVFSDHNYGYGQQNDILIWFAYAFAAVFFLTSIINIINSKETDLKAFLWTAIGNGIFVLAWVMNFVAKEWQSSVIAIWMVVFAIGSFIAFSNTKIKSVFFVYASVAIAMLIVATTIELDGAALIVAYTVESFLVPVLIYYATRDVQASSIGSLLIILPTFLSLGNLDKYYRSDAVISKDSLVILLVIITLLALGFMYKKIKETGTKEAFYLDGLFLTIGSIYAYVLLWAVLQVGIGIESVAVTFSLVIFTIIGLIKYFYGIYVGSKFLRNYGGIVIGFVILRLLFIDIWDMEIGVRVFVFILIGILLMSTAFISRQFKSGFVDKVNH
jgi:uncharacterized membrane protein